MTKILIVRRDNIGDLICTLPLIASIRDLHPKARIDLLVNSYSAAVVERNPDVDHVYIYTKAKHREAGKSVFGVYARRIWLTLKLRFIRYDWLILANVGCLPRPLRWAKQVGAKNVIGFSASGCAGAKILTHPIPLPEKGSGHEVEYVMKLLAPLGAKDCIPPARVFPDPEKLSRASMLLQTVSSKRALIGINISARLVSQQWPAESFIRLIRLLQTDFRCALFWSPGSASSAGHPGDDDKAAIIIAACQGLQLIPWPTQNLSDLIAGIACIDLLVTADGGALHIGAACSKPIVAMFGDSDATQWYPWQVPATVLQTETRDVRSISAETVAQAVVDLMIKVQQ